MMPRLMETERLGKKQTHIPYLLVALQTFHARVRNRFIAFVIVSWLQDLVSGTINEALKGLEILDLKQAALKHITRSLTIESITTELTSEFTSRYPEIRQIQKEYLIAHWVS